MKKEPLTSEQLRLWFEWKLNPDSTAYNTAMQLELHGALDLFRFKEAVKNIGRTLEISRTYFEEDREEPYQAYLSVEEAKERFKDLEDPEIPSFHFIDLSNENNTLEMKRELAYIQHQKAVRKHFNLTEYPLVHFTLIKYATDKYLFSLVAPHMVSDGYTGVLVLKLLTAFYNQDMSWEMEKLEGIKDKKQYLGYVQETYSPSKKAEDERHWLERLQDAKLQVNFGISQQPLANPRQGARMYFSLEPQMVQDIQRLIASEKTTIFIVLSALFSSLLSRYFREDDITLSYSSTTRPKGFKYLCGFFVNTLLLRTKLPDKISFIELIRQLLLIRGEDRKHKDYPYTDLVRSLRRESPQFTGEANVAIAQTAFGTYDLNFNELKVIPILNMDYGEVQNDLTLLYEYNKAHTSLELAFEYRSAIFEEWFIQEMQDSFKVLIVAVLENPKRNIFDLPLLLKVKLQQQLVVWNQTARDYPKDKTIHQLFEEQMEKTPDNIAVVFENQQLTYRELNARANQLAHYLQGQGVSIAVPVGLSIRRIPDMIVSMLGILKAGGIYVPLDPNYPKERLRYILEDAKPNLIITYKELSPRFCDLPCSVICLDVAVEKIAQCSCENIESLDSQPELSHYLATSGSTGRPKCIILRHQGVVALIAWAKRTYRPEDLRMVLAGTSINWDLSVFEIFVPLSVGGRIALLENALHLPTFPQANRVTFINSVPSSVQQLLEVGAIPKSVRIVNLTGEPLSKKIVQDLYGLAHIKEVWNLYGPGEDTTYSTYYLVPRDSNVPMLIGKPLDNKQVYVLDPSMQLVPPGVIGELYTGGVGVAQGYVNRPGLTAERFIPNPFGEGRLYRSGDLVRYLPDGNIEFVGRADFQIKLRGFRIELGEIEAVLDSYPSVTQSVVVLCKNESGNKYLAAYLVPKVVNPDGDSKDGEGFAQSLLVELGSYLSNKLPNYMIPTSYTVLDKLPLNTNGKIDRKALPKPGISGQLAESYVAPRNDIEETLATIWSEVLKVEKVGINNNFFTLGGDSLIAMRLMSRVKAKFQLEIPLRALFETLTISSLGAVIKSEQQKQPGLRKTSSLKVMAYPEHIPLSFAQQRLWFLDKLIPNSPMYNMCGALKLEGALNLQYLEKAFQVVIVHHESLRTTFKEIRGEVYQSIAPTLDFKLVFESLEQLEGGQQANNLTIRVKQDALTPFNLEQGPLIRAKLYQLSSTAYVLLLNIHHIISDGWSMGILLRELSASYNAYLQGTLPVLPPLVCQYVDFAIWQREWLQNEVLTKQLNYWQQELQGIPAVIELPLDRPRTAQRTYTAGNYTCQLAADITTGLNALSQEQNVTMFVLLLSIFQILLHRSSQQETVVVGTPIANRHYPEIENLMGFFANTIAIRIDSINTLTFTETLAQIKRKVINAFDNQDLPFEQLVDHLKIERGLDHQPVFQVMFMMDEWQLLDEIQLAGLKVAPYSGLETAAKFDLTLNVEKTRKGELNLSFEYAKDIFNTETIQSMAQHFIVLTQGVLENPTQKITNLPLLTQAELHQQLVVWNQTVQYYPADKTIHQLFEEQAERTPDNIAAVLVDQQLTYRELNEQANQLAHYLVKLGLQDEAMVALSLDKSLELIVGVLAILKGGAVYVPIDPSYPSERQQFILEDSHARVLITDSGKSTKFSQYPGIILEIDKCAEKLKKEKIDNLNLSGNGTNLAYVIYTSGSTGKPKGILLEHKTITNLLTWQKSFVVDPIKSSQFASIGFDVSVQEMFYPLLQGGELTIVPPALRTNFKELGFYLEKAQVNEVFLPTAALSYFCREVTAASLVLPKLRHIIVAGEQLKITNDVTKFIRIHPHITLWNHYGPAETHVVTAERLLGTEVANWKACPDIGKPIANSKMYILDQNQMPSPKGTIGELYIGGVGLARGYLNHPELTAERFIPNPFGESRLYKTGDLVRYLPDGNIEFIGRTDFQVKLRGFRIEPGEIEAVLHSHSSIAQAAVVLREDNPGNKYLAAYLVLNKEATPSLSAELRNYLSNKLPNYMVPASFMVLDKLPLNTNGKINRQVLPEPDLKGQLIGDYVAPRNSLEEALTAIWREVLGIEKVGINDNFFALGGHSLLVVHLVSCMNKVLPQPINVQRLFTHPTIKQIIEYVPTEDLPINLAQEALLDEEIRPAQNANGLPSVFKNILITGATGFVGSYLLSELLSTTEAKIHCLIRGTSVVEALERLKANLLANGVWQEAYFNRIIPVLGDIAKPFLGLPQLDFIRLSEEIDTVYHNAVLMNHFASYDYLKPSNVDGTKEILRFACAGKLKRVHYVSTTGIFSQTTYTGVRIINETTPIENEQHYNCSGYASGYAGSKWVAEKLVSLAKDRGIPCNIYRLGLVLWDDKTGKYEETQWLYKLIKSCLMLGLYPVGIKLSLPLISVNEAAKALIYLSRQNTSNEIYHLFYPQIYSLDELLKTLNQKLHVSLKSIPASEWFQWVKTYNNAQQDLPIKNYLEEDSSMQAIEKVQQRNNADNQFESILTWSKLPWSNRSMAKVLFEEGATNFLRANLQHKGKLPIYSREEVYQRIQEEEKQKELRNCSPLVVPRRSPRDPGCNR